MKKSLIDKYLGIESSDIIVNEKTINYKGKEYKEKDWFNKINSFSKITENEILLENKDIKELPSTICKFFCENVRKTSFLGLILPQVVFLLISFISFSAGDIIEHSENFEIFGKMLIFMGVIYLLIVLILFIKTIRGEKLYQRKVRGQSRFQHINKTEYERILNCFQKLIVGEHYYINRLKQQIDNDTFILREFRMMDSLALYKVFCNPEVFKYLLSNEFKSIEDAKEYIRNCINDYKNKKKYKLAFVVNDQLIGYIGLSGQDLTSTTCQIIYAIGEEYWHHGYVAKGLSFFIPYLKENGMKTIYCGHVKENVNSGKVMQKVGFVRCEERDTTMMVHGEEKEIVAYILKETEKEIEENKDI